MALLQVPITFVLALYFWRWPDLSQLVLMFVIGLLVGGAHYTLTVAYDRAEVGAMEPVNFFRLVLASIIGLVFFAELPDLWTVIGGLVIVPQRPTSPIGNIVVGGKERPTMGRERTRL